VARREEEEEEEVMVLVAEAVGAGWNKVTFEMLVDRCGVVCVRG
jgi:hypothetical protein